MAARKRIKRKSPKKSKLYVGKRKSDGEREVFRSATTPTESSHGHKYGYSVGPFRTAAGAHFFVQSGQGNPHIRTAGDADRIAKKLGFKAPGKSWRVTRRCPFAECAKRAKSSSKRALENHLSNYHGILSAEIADDARRL